MTLPGMSRAAVTAIGITFNAGGVQAGGDLRFTGWTRRPKTRREH